MLIGVIVRLISVVRYFVLARHMDFRYILFIIHTWFCLLLLTAVLNSHCCGPCKYSVLARLFALPLVLCMPTDRVECGHLMIIALLASAFLRSTSAL